MTKVMSGSRPRVLVEGLAVVESGRWHDDRLWFSHWGANELLAVDLEGRLEHMADAPDGLGWSADWLPDGRLLVTGPELTRYEADGTAVRHTDLSAVAPLGVSEIVVDGRGNIYLNEIGFDFLGGEPPGPGTIILVTPDGSARRVADGISFPNGMVVTPDNSTLIVSESFTGTLLAFEIEDDGSLAGRRAWAKGVAPDGITLDAEGAIWTSPEPHAVARVHEGGKVTDRVELDLDPFACALGGPDARTLFILAAEWRGPDQVEAALAARTGTIFVVDAPAPRAGWP
jgi:sugar lactone lactonase YvrE